MKSGESGLEESKVKSGESGLGESKVKSKEAGLEKSKVKSGEARLEKWPGQRLKEAKSRQLVCSGPKDDKKGK